MLVAVLYWHWAMLVAVLYWHWLMLVAVLYWHWVTNGPEFLVRTEHLGGRKILFAQFWGSQCDIFKDTDRLNRRVFLFLICSKIHVEIGILSSTCALLSGGRWVVSDCALTSNYWKRDHTSERERERERILWEFEKSRAKGSSFTISTMFGSLNYAHLPVRDLIFLVYQFYKRHKHVFYAPRMCNLIQLGHKHVQPSWWTTPLKFCNLLLLTSSEATLIWCISLPRLWQE